MDAALQKVASLFGAAPLIATSAVGHSGLGGALGGFGSDFQLARPGMAEIAGGDGETIRLGETIAASVQVLTGDRSAIAGATVHLYAEVPATVACTASNPTCSESTQTFGGVMYNVASVLTNAGGFADVDWTPMAVGLNELKALGCGIGVESPDGNDSNGTDWDGANPIDHDVVGRMQLCDRSPADSEDASVGSFANGQLAGLDPFEPDPHEVTTPKQPAIALNDLPLTIEATVCDVQGSATVDGMLEAAWQCAERRDFLANLSGGGKTAQASVFWMNDNDYLYMALRVERDAADKTHKWAINFDNDNDGTAEANDDFLLVEADKNGVTLQQDGYLTAGCAGSGQSICGDPDDAPPANGNNDIVAAFSNDGTHSVYELKHKLNGDAGIDIPLASQGDKVGFFLALALGKGAQGNTQWPDFRVFEEIERQ